MDCLVSQSPPSFRGITEMSPAATKTCGRCGEGFRGTLAPDEVYCAKCYVKTCSVPDDIDEQFLKLVRETYGPELAMVNPPSSKHQTGLLPMMKDVLNHKARLKRLEKNTDEENDRGKAKGKSTKEKNRIKREIYRLREEQKEMEDVMDSVKAKMLHLALIHPSNNKQVEEKGDEVKTKTSGGTKNEQVEDKKEITKKSEDLVTSPLSTTSSAPFSTPLQSPTTPPSPKKDSKSSPVPYPSPKKQKEEPDNSNQENEQPHPKTPTSPTTSSLKQSPVKLAAARFEEAAKKVNSMVTFAKLPENTKSSSKKSGDGGKGDSIGEGKKTKKEVNNNDTPVTASSSSEDEAESENPSGLARSNSVRDRIKAFEDIQRRASTGSFDRRRTQNGRAGVMSQRSLASMKTINI